MHHVSLFVCLSVCLFGSDDIYLSYDIIMSMIRTCNLPIDILKEYKLLCMGSPVSPHPPPQLDAGFIVWTFQGRLLYRNPRSMERFCQLLWRPRPPSLLTDEELKVSKCLCRETAKNNGCRFGTARTMSDVSL